MAVGDDYTTIYGQLSDTLNLSGELDSLPLTDLARKFVPELPAALGTLQLNGVYLRLTSAAQIDFSASVQWDIQEALHALGLPPLPDGTANIELSSLSFTTDLTAKTWRIELTPQDTFSFPASGAHQIAMSNISVSIANDGIGCQFTLDGESVINDSFSLSATSIACSCESANKRWHFGGTLIVELFGERYPFVPDINVDARIASFVLDYADDLALSPWPDYASIRANNLQIALSKAETKSEYHWAVLGNADVDIAGGFIVADGTLEMSDNAFRLSADVRNSPSVELTVIPGKPRIDVTLNPLKLTLGDRDTQNLSVGGSVTVKGMPSPANSVFPDGTSAATLKMDNRGFAITFKPLADPTIAIDFLDIHFPEIVIEELLLRQSATTAGSKQWQLGARLNVAGFAQLNKLFDNADLFEDNARLLMTVGQGVSIALDGPSPLKPVKLQEPREDGSIWTEWLEIRDTGRFSFRVPEFAFDFAGGRWRASGGMTSQGDLTLPLGLVKRALASIGLEKLLAMMPDKIPLTELDLTSKDLYQQFEKVLGKLPEVETAIFRRLTDLLQQGVEKLPDNMHEYLRINIPDELTFDIAVEPTGGYEFGLRTRGDPLRLLLPWLSLSGPGLLGATIHHLSLGLSGGGSVAVLKTDAYFDQFDAPGLIYSLLIGEGRTLRNRFEMRETTILLPTAAPFPLPLFYRRFGWSYHDMLGIQLDAHAAFGPLTEPPLTDWIDLIGKLVSFLTKPAWYLHEHDIPRSMQLPFTLGPAFLALPNYLGGSTLGADKTLPTLPVATSLAMALDGIKTGNIGWIIQSVPLRHPNQSGGTWIRVAQRNRLDNPSDVPGLDTI